MSAMRTLGTISVGILSVALAAPPVFAFDDTFFLTSEDLLPDAPNTDLTIDGDLGLVYAFSDNVDPALLSDLEVRLLGEHYLENGWQVQLNFEGRWNRNTLGDPLGQPLPFCDLDPAACPSVRLNSRLRPIVAGYSGFRPVTEISPDRNRASLETASLTLKTGWFDAHLGYGPGAARLDPAGGPTAFRLTRADAGRVNTTGIDATRTINETSSRSPKLTVQSVELGQASSVGSAWVAVSFTPDTQGCFAEVCRDAFGPEGQVQPVAEDVIELAFRYEIERAGVEWAISADWSQALSQSKLIRDDGSRPDAFSTVSAGLSARYDLDSGGLEAGMRYLVSNNGWSDDARYHAMSVSAGFEQGLWLSTIEWSGFEDDLFSVDGETVQIGTSRLIGDHFVAGAGWQVSRQKMNRVSSTTLLNNSSRVDTFFIEFGVQF
ncbi:hypothetical protein RMQ97_01010 [Maricaulis sp. D1M11]|uniref:hypothetical protein n=1 Tax=Maricaulis sp. D1M11 TaxID=3076117 RepID=UPI0039B38EF8